MNASENITSLHVFEYAISHKDTKYLNLTNFQLHLLNNITPIKCG